MTVLAAIDWDSLLQSTAAAIAAGVGITFAFAIGMRGLIRSSELRGEGRSLGASVAGDDRRDGPAAGDRRARGRADHRRRRRAVELNPGG